MAEFIQVITVVRRLFLPDVIPWTSLAAESNLEKLRARYKFNELPQHGVDPAAGNALQFVCPKGEFVVDERALLVEQFTIEPSVLQFQIVGDSDQANKFAEDLGKFFLEIDSQKSYSETGLLTQTYQTIAVVKLSFPYEALFADRFSRFLTETASPSITPENTEIELRLLSLRWIVSYRPNTPDFTYVPKMFVIEPRQGSRPSDMHYYTQSPSDFKAHKELIEALEKALS